MKLGVGRVVAVLVSAVALAGGGAALYISQQSDLSPMFQDVTVAVLGSTARVAQTWGQITVLDYDRDGDDDVFLHEHYNDAPSTPHLLRNNGKGMFTEMPNPFPPVTPDTRHRHVWLACDIDVDGDDDMIVATGNAPSGGSGADPTRDLWLRNDTLPGGAPVFTDITLALGTSDNPTNQGAGTCFDYQNDGDLDVMWVIGDMRPARPEMDAVHLWVKDAGGWRLAPSTEIGQYDNNGAGGAASREPYSVDCGDFQNDGDLDCVNSGVNAWPGFEGRFLGYELYNCEGGAPLNEVCSYMLGGTQSAYSGNALIGEFTGDDKLDIYVVENAGPFGLWSEALPGPRLRVTWSADFDRGPAGQGTLVGGAASGDFDNDGALDVFQLGEHNGILCDFTWAAKDLDFLWINNGSGSFVNQFVGSGLDGFRNVCGPDLSEGVTDAPGAGGVAVIDYDLDGRLDLIVGYNDGDHQSPFRVYRNVIANGNAWIGLKLLSPAGSSPLGAKVEARPMGSTVWRTVFLTARTAWLSQSSRMVHVGLGPGDPRVNAEVRITWRNGTVQNLTLGMNQYHIVNRPPQEGC